MKNMSYLIPMFCLLISLFLHRCLIIIGDSQPDTSSSADILACPKNDDDNSRSTRITCNDNDNKNNPPSSDKRKKEKMVGNRYCFDEHAQCNQWVEEDSDVCETKPSFMKVFCRLSCGVCTPTFSFPWCQDRNTACGYWASIGECQKNEPYMLDQCERSCNQCPIDPILMQRQPEEGEGGPFLPTRGYYRVIEKKYHSSNAFTQGLTFSSNNGILYESIGNYGESEIRKIDPNTGRVLQSRRMEPQYFGEGLTLFDNHKKLIQLTYKENAGFIYDSESLELIQRFNFVSTTQEGWGITYDEATDTLFVSDGSEWLSIWDASSLTEIRRIRVTYNGEPLAHINELEFMESISSRRILLANVFTTDAIVGINPDTGVVEILFDFTDLWPYHDRSHHVDVFNGISKTAVDDEIYVTGKFWPFLYRIKLFVEKNEQ